MKLISRINLVLAILNVCVGTAMIVFSAITAAKYTTKKIERI